MVKSMNKDAIVMPMANPTPEIMPDLALNAGAKVVGTGRSDFPNQVNNLLAFPGIFRGAFDVRARDINDEMQKAAAYAIASLVINIQTFSSPLRLFLFCRVRWVQCWFAF